MNRLIPFDAYCRAIRDATVSFVLTRRAEANWAFQFVAGEQLSIQFGADGGASIADGINRPDACLILFRHRPSHARIAMNGRVVSNHDFVLVPPGRHFVFAANGPRTWISVAISPRRLVRVCESQEVVRSKLAQSSPDVISGTAALHSDAVRLVERRRQSPSADLDGLGVDEVEPCIVKFFADLIQQWSQPEPSHIDKRHHDSLAIVMRALRVLHVEAVADRWFVEELARAADVCPRTLLRDFHAILDVSPKQYLRLRQLNLVRQALRESPSRRCVTDIMTWAGVTEFGRFAGQYRALFGELPSETMRATAAVGSSSNSAFSRT